MAVSKRTRYEVLRRDNHTCRYCGGAAPGVTLTVDHVTPVALGGSDDPSNLVAACRDCNAGKSSTAPGSVLVEDVKQDSLRWAAAMKLAASRLDARDEPRRQYVTHMEDVVLAYYGDYKDLPNDWHDSVEGFYRAGLPVHLLERAVDVAMSRESVSWYSKWRYACGVAWNLLREMQDEARRILEADD